MIKINLLPEKIRSAESLKTSIILAALGLVLVSGGFGFFYSQRLAGLNVVRQERKQVEAEMNSPELKKMVSDVEEFVRQSKNFQDQMANLNRFREKQVILVKLLDMLPDLVPDNVYLMEVSQADDKGKTRITLKGAGLTTADVSKMYIALESQGFKNLSLDAPATPVKTMGAIFFNFTISFDYEG